MLIIKLDAIDSTNSYLRELLQKKKLETFTVVSAKSQTNGKGQMGSTWTTESDKNLIISILINNSVENINQIFDLNIIVALSVIAVLNSENIPNLSIKWPNDIMSENKKIGGILIENIIKENGVINSIIGIGLNVNQTHFENLPKASSLKNSMQMDFDIDLLIEKIVVQLKDNLKNLDNFKQIFWNDYNNLLFKKDVPTVFQDANKNNFMGIIQNVNTDGTLKLLLENDKIQSFKIKEISMLY